MPRTTRKITFGNRGAETSTSSPCARDLAALYRLEDSMARARRHAQQNAPGTPNQREAFLEQCDHTDQDNFEYNLNPGLEDNADDDDEGTDGFWVTMGKDEPDSIDLMVSTSTKQYRQRACDFNWRTLLNHLHPVYMTQKIVTKNWANSNCYNDSNQICQCEKTYRMVDMVDIRGILLSFQITCLTESYFF
ncbi:hypothetical protein PCASD_24214 [Puccinia coronata f. sp. avenae]|uniref:CxC1-like cysteine cluster associated with KDZ transposases domain-containing protein n=1 Tax=Puccinia coronata f. sp. avenae TaxID=200324 RepID=A0A2N5S5U4_9BASI|nr:hypothetical protein PCASD_24214 [Puccinia coronata f. sp. avenae]